MRHENADQSATLTKIKLSAVGYTIALVSQCIACVYIKVHLAVFAEQCKCGRDSGWEEHGPFRVVEASTRKKPRLAAKKVGLATEFQSSAGVRTGEQAGVVELVEGVVLVVATMVVVEEMTGELVVQMVEALVDHNTCAVG